MKDFRAFRNRPTVMGTSAELVVMRALRAMPLEYLSAHRDEFLEVVKDLDCSHADSGVFGLTPDNEAEFHAFTAWLRQIGPQMGEEWPADDTWALDVTFEQAANAFPGMRQDAAEGAQPGSPVAVQLVERVAQAGELPIAEAVAGPGGGIRLTGEGWIFCASPDWRMLNRDGTLASAWSTPGVEKEVAELVGLRVEEAAVQSRLTAADPAFRLSDGRWLEVFSVDPLFPWFMRLPGGVFSGAPTAPEWV